MAAHSSSLQNKSQILRLKRDPVLLKQEEKKESPRQNENREL